MSNISNKRESNFELLRIFAMFLIIWNHLCNAIWIIPNAETSINTIISKAFYIWTGNLGNWLFILLSGYFVSNSKFSWKKVFKLWFQVISVSVIVGILFKVFNGSIIYADVDSLGFANNNEEIIVSKRLFNNKDLLRSFFPILFGNNWYASAYLLFYMFTPFLNEFIVNLNESKHRTLIIFMIVVGTVIYMIPEQGIFQSNNLFYFILGYFIANYIKKYNPKILNNKKINLIMSLVIPCLFIAWIILILLYRKKIGFIDSNFIQVFCYPFALTRFPVLLNAIFLFSLFKNLHVRYNRFINLFAGTTFGVYLIHENPFFKTVLWHCIFKINNFIYSRYLFLYMLFAVIATFFCCSLLDLIRSYFIEKPVLMLISKEGKK